MKLWVRDIQRFCLHDGPGIRTTLFLQGCPLRCWWCHNPHMRPVRAAAARPWTTTALAQRLERDARFWRSSGGGLTVSGGEPLLQASAVAALLRFLGRRGHHRAVETAGAVSAENLRILSPQVDLWLWDVKSLDAQAFGEGTGGDLDRVLENLAWVLRETLTPVRVRVPLIRGFNTDPDAMEPVAAWLAKQPRRVAVEILPGHDTGRRAADAACRSAVVTAQEVAQAQAAMKRAGLDLAGDMP